RPCFRGVSRTRSRLAVGEAGAGAVGLERTTRHASAAPGRLGSIRALHSRRRMEGTGSFEPHRTRAGLAHHQFTRAVDTPSRASMKALKSPTCTAVTRAPAAVVMRARLNHRNGARGWCGVVGAGSTRPV